MVNDPPARADVENFTETPERLVESGEGSWLYAYDHERANLAAITAAIRGKAAGLRGRTPWTAAETGRDPAEVRSAGARVDRALLDQLQAVAAG